MRQNSGKDESRNNRGNPGLAENQQQSGRSGEAITGAKKHGGTPNPTPARSSSGKR